MRLSNLATPTRGYSHFLGKCNLPGKIAEKRLKELLPQIRLQNQKAIEEVICGHIRLAMEIVGRYLFVLKHDRWVNDLVGAAMEGLCVAVNGAAEKLKDDNITGYIVATIHGHISHTIERIPLVCIPPTTFRRKACVQPKVLPIEVLNCPTTENSDLKLIELREIIDKIAISDTHKQILTLREHGYRDSEIAAQLDLAPTSVWLMRLEMQQRYLELTHGME